MDKRGTPLTDHQVDEVTAMMAAASREALMWYRPNRRPPSQAGNGRSVSIDNKRTEGYDPVTEADRTVERLIRSELQRMFPDHAVTGEEYGTTGSGPIEWLIDPVDGTRAFITGQPMWGTLLGLSIDRRPVAGWMHLPVLDETYIGANDSSRLQFPSESDSERVQVPLAVGSTTRLEDATVLCTHPSMFAPGPENERFEALTERVRMVRYGGDCMNYGLLAGGEADLVVENQLAPYDIVPLLPIITGAGGVVSDLDGRPPLDGGYVVAAATPELLEAALAVLRG